MITRRGFLTLSAAAAGVGVYTWRFEPHWVQVVRRPLDVVNLPGQLVGAKLVQLSDLHIGERVSDDYLLSVFDLVRDLAPDFVVYTGDFASHYDGILDHTERMFQHLPLGNRGTLGIFGNHDYGLGCQDFKLADSLASQAENAGVKLLRNEIADVDGLHVVGLDDLWADRCQVPQTLASIEANQPAIVLAHNPDIADLPGWLNFDGWILSGHTHGGQCKPPFLPPPMLPVKNRRYTAGEFDLNGGRRLYINRGIGHLLRVRFNVRPEVTVFELAKRDRARA